MYFQLLFWPVSDILFEVVIAEPFEWTKLKVLNSVDVGMLVVIGRHMKRCFDLKPVVMRACRSQFLCQFPFTTGNADHCHRKRSFFFSSIKNYHSPRNYHPSGSDGKAAACGDLDSIPGLGRSPGKGNGYPIQYSCLKNPMDAVKIQEHIKKNNVSARRQILKIQ